MIESLLPTPPANHHYEIERVSKMMSKVWLVRDEPSQLLEKDIRTIYCFVKGSKNLTIHKPMDTNKCYVKKFCELDELSSQPPYSLFIPKVTRLSD
jgi:hypothetical protein